jgi:hypothetical protein
MGHQTNSQRKISIIVPAYNEEARIGGVLDVVSTYPGAEVIVVDDGSTDDTEKIASRYPVRFVKNKVNRGKGFAMDRGVRLAHEQVIFFCDADVKGLTHAMIDTIVEPVLHGDVDMFIGMRNRKMYLMSHIFAIVPLMGGERALTKTLWKQIPARYKKGFIIETAMNFYAKYYGRGFAFTVIRGLSQTIKERKYGFWNGQKSRWAMMYTIFATQIRLQLREIPYEVHELRKSVGVVVSAAIGVGIGIVLVAVSLNGPRLLIAKLVGEPGAFTRFVVDIAQYASRSGLMAIGAAIVIVNIVVILLSIHTIVKTARVKRARVRDMIASKKTPKEKIRYHVNV